jgi:hypothetical protein
MMPDSSTLDLKMDPTELYREEVFTDRKAGTLRRLTPVKTDGSADAARAVIYVGQAQLLTPMGALPLSFEIDARSMKEAMERFPQAAKVAVDQAVEELKELRREASSSIVIPEAGGGLGGAGGVPSAGKIQLP